MKAMQLFKHNKPVIGMIHLFALPPHKSRDSLQKQYTVEENITKALKDLKALEGGGADAALIENDDDPSDAIYAGKQQYEAMHEIATAVLKEARIPIGVNVLRNDWAASFLIAKKTGCKFIRLDNFVDKVKMAGKVVEEDPEQIAKFREKIGADDILFFTDVHVKHAELLETKSITESVKQAVANGADGIIITGRQTGEAPDIEDLKEAKLATGQIPVLIGSGLNHSNCHELMQDCDGAIVGTALKIGQYVDAQKVRDMMKLRHSDDFHK
jgi:hypothetical protein